MLSLRRPIKIGDTYREKKIGRAHIFATPSRKKPFKNTKSTEAEI